MTKPKIYLDFDNTIVNSTLKFCSVYNELFQLHPDFVPARWQYVDQWDFKDEAPLVRNVEGIFQNRLFFDNLPFINDNTYEVLQRLSEKYHIIIVSIGTYGNISLKSQWIGEYLPFIKESILLVNNGNKMDKGLVDMSIRNDEHYPIFIDDVVKNLDSSNAKYKIAFGDIHAWNREWDGDRCMNWTEVDKLLLS